MENKMSEVAKLLGVELEEKFRIVKLSTKYKLSKGGLKYWSGSPKKWNDSGLLEDLIIGKLTIIKLPKPILDDIEKEYLSAVIKPFRNQVILISKSSNMYGEYIGIEINENGGNGTILLPYFEQGKMYKGMEVDRVYTLDQLEL